MRKRRSLQHQAYFPMNVTQKHGVCQHTAEAGQRAGMSLDQTGLGWKRDGRICLPQAAFRATPASPEPPLPEQEPHRTDPGHSSGCPVQIPWGSQPLSWCSPCGYSPVHSSLWQSTPQIQSAGWDKVVLLHQSVVYLCTVLHYSREPQTTLVSSPIELPVSTKFPLTWHTLHKTAEVPETWNMAKYRFIVKP